jgi:hypothetical protein
MELPGLVSWGVHTDGDHGDTAAADGFCAGNFGEAEIQNFGVAALGDENVGGLDVAMNDAFAVGGVERVGNLDGEIEQVVQFHRAAGDGVLQSLAVEKFHRDEGFAVRFANIVNRADVGMVQGGGGLGFSLETREGLRIFRDVVWQEFQRDETVQADVLGFVHDAHASAAEAFQDAIVGEGLVEERIVAGHVLDILGCGKRQVNEDELPACG